MSETIKGEPISENMHSEFSDATAVRVYDQANAAGDFPVLKAFQEYLEAEQAKANKRMLALSIFFIVLLVIVVLTFSVITSCMIGRNQTLTDRLMNLAEGRMNAPIVQPSPAAAPIVNVQPPPVAPAPSIDNSNPILAKLEALEAELSRARAAAAEAEARAAAKAANEADSKTGKQSPSATDASAKNRANLDTIQRQQEEILRQQEALKAARVKLKAEQEALHKEEVEKHRRLLYPEYYAQEDARRAREEAAKNPPPALPATVAPTAAAPVPPAQPSQPAAQAQPPKRVQIVVPPPPPAQPAPSVPPANPPAAPAPVAKTASTTLPATDNAVPVPPVTTPPPPKKSALQQLLDIDDAPKAPAVASGTNTKLSDEEQKKIAAELKDLQQELEKLEAEEKKANGNAVQKTAPAAEVKPPASVAEKKVENKDGNKAGKQVENKANNKPSEVKSPSPAVQIPQTESLNVGAKDGKSIPWLIDIPGETPVEPKNAEAPAAKPDAKQPSK